MGTLIKKELLEVENLLNCNEDKYFDRKSSNIKPSKLAEARRSYSYRN